MSPTEMSLMNHKVYPHPWKNYHMRSSALLFFVVGAVTALLTDDSAEYHLLCFCLVYFRHVQVMGVVFLGIKDLAKDFLSRHVKG